MPKFKKFKGLAKDFINAMRTQFIGQGADPNDIFVQDLYNYESSSSNTGLSLLKKHSGRLMSHLSTEDRRIVETILRVYNEHIKTKRELLEQSRNLYETSDVVNTVIDVMIDDGFNSFQNEKEEFRIEYRLSEEDKELLGEDFQDNIQNIIDEFVSKFGLKTRIAEIVPELLRDGEYAFGVVFDDSGKKGITDIIDDMDVINMLPFYEGDKLAFVMNQNIYEDKPSIDNIPAFYKPDNIIFFRLKGNTKKRINLSDFYDNDFRKKFYAKTNIRLPKYIRVPLPIYYSAIKNLNRLQVMENVSTVTDLAGILKPEIVSVTVPSNTNAEEAKQIIRDYERQLNDNSAITESDNLDISTLGAQAYRRKVLPVWMDSKGTIATSEVGSHDSTKNEGAWNSVNNIRNFIALSIGIPPFYLNPNASAENKAQVIKLYSRYTRKLTGLQKTLADGVKDIICLHLEKKGINISRENLEVKFKAITSGDSLDDTDMMVATVTGINDLYKGLEEIVSSENNNLVIDDKQFKQLFDNLTSRYLNISDLLRIEEKKFNEEEFGDDEEGFEASEGPSSISGPSRSSSDDFDNFASPSSNEPTGETDVYSDFASSEDNLNIVGPQEITTET